MSVNNIYINATTHGEQVTFSLYQNSWALCNMEYSSETHLKTKSRVVSFDSILFSSCPIVWKFWIIVMSCFYAKFQNDWRPDSDVMDERDFVRFELKIHFGYMSYIPQGPGLAIFTMIVQVHVYIYHDSPSTRSQDSPSTRTYLPW